MSVAASSPIEVKNLFHVVPKSFHKFPCVFLCLSSLSMCVHGFLRPSIRIPWLIIAFHKVSCVFTASQYMYSLIFSVRFKVVLRFSYPNVFPYCSVLFIASHFSTLLTPQPSRLRCVKCFSSASNYL